MIDTEDPKPALVALVMDEITKLGEIQNRWLENLSRIARIVYVNTRLDPERIMLEGRCDEVNLIAYLDDINRMIIVFSHSAIEASVCDVVQYLLKLRYTYDQLGVLSLLDQKRNFSIEELRAAKGKTSEEMIEDYTRGQEKVIDQFLSNRSFNQKNDVTKQLKSIGLDTRALAPQLEFLNRMMYRRHSIAHKLDYIEENGKKRLNQIESSEVVEWTNNLMDFLHALLKEILLSDRLALDLEGKAKSLGIPANTKQIKKLINGVLHQSRLDIPWSKVK